MTSSVLLWWIVVNPINTENLLKNKTPDDWRSLRGLHLLAGQPWYDQRYESKKKMLNNKLKKEQNKLKKEHNTT